ncbi:MAG: glycosyltransferase [Verrucomicrobium sp.]|nr:glycosyltransferase [Verrucomicrobium sp.]
MKLCDVTQFFSPRSGGVRRYLLEKRRYIEERTDDEHHLVIPGEKTEYKQEGRLHTFTVASPQVSKTSRYRVLFNTPAVRDYLRQVRPDLVEAGDPYHLAWSLLRSGRELFFPVLGFYHSHFPDAYLRTILKYCGPFMRDAVLAYAEDYIVRLYGQFAATLVPSEPLRDLLRGWGVGNAVSVRLGVDTDSFRPGLRDAALREELGIPQDAFLLLYVGRLAGEKNVTTLLQAFAELRRRSGRNYWLLILGDGPLRRLLPAVREETGAVRWQSFIQGNDKLARYYRAADLFVHPGVVETFGLVALEAQACGCPIVGIRGSNMDANIAYGLEHWAPRNDAGELAAAIERVAETDLALWGETAAERVRERFAWPVVLGDLWRHYRAAIAGNRVLASY